MLPSAWPVLAVAPPVVGTYAALYLAAAYAAGFPEIEAWTARFFQ
jgi:hypothetical protein